MLDDMESINRRMDEITTELAQHKAIEHYDITLEAKPKGVIKYRIESVSDSDIAMTGTIAKGDPVDSISDALGGNNTITPRGAHLIAAVELRYAMFNELGHLVLNFNEGFASEFRCKKEHRAEIISILKERFGDKFKG